MDFGLSEEQKLIVETTRAFVENELYPHEREVERTGVLRRELIEEIKVKAIEAGLYAANMPADVVQKLNAGLNAALRDKATIAKLAESAVQPWPTTPEQFAKHVGAEIARWQKVAQDAGIQPE